MAENTIYYPWIPLAFDLVVKLTLLVTSLYNCLNLTLHGLPDAAETASTRVQVASTPPGVFRRLGSVFGVTYGVITLELTLRRNNIAPGENVELWADNEPDHRRRRP